MKAKNLLITTLTGALALVAVGCGGGGGGGGGGVGYDPYYHAWYDVYGYACYGGADMYPAPGCNYYSDGVKIIDTEDPYYSTNYALSYGSWDYVDAYGYTQTFTGWAWISPDNVMYDEYGYALNKRDQAKGRDLLGQAGEKEAEMITKAAEGFADRYALSSEVSMNVATTLHDVAVFSKSSRRMTNNDRIKFAEKLFGVDATSASTKAQFAKMLASKSLSAVDGLVEQQAQYWGSDPETVKKIDLTWGKASINALGLK